MSHAIVCQSPTDSRGHIGHRGVCLVINGGCSIERSALGALDTWHTLDTAAGGRTLGTLGTLGHLSPLLASRSRELGPATHLVGVNCGEQ